MNGLTKSLVAVSTLSGILAGCATTEEPPVSAPVTVRHDENIAKGNQQLNYQLGNGVYGCELGQKVEIQRNVRNARLIEINWQGKPHTLQRYDSYSGLPRYEDRSNGLMWIELPWKGVLMDTQSGRPLANECKVTSS